jgi:small-conductance mechanosensitive channel
VDWITSEFGIAGRTQGKILASLIVVVVALVVRVLILRAVQRRVDETDVLYRTGKLATYATTIVVGLTLGWIWFSAFSSVGTYIAVVSAGLAIALADVLKNVAGWGYIVVRRPFRVGDRIEISGTKGDVLDVRLFRFTVAEVGNWVDAEQATGRLVHIPNGTLFGEQVANYTEGFEFIWHEIPVLVTFETDWKRAEEILLEIVRDTAPNIEARAGARIREAARNYQIKIGVLTPIIYLTVKDSGILLTARYLTDVRARRSIEQRVWRRILEAFAGEAGIQLAYPTVRTYLEGPIRLDSGADPERR